MPLGSLLKKAFLLLLGNDGNPFSIMGFLHPTNSEGKYVIEAEGIRLAFVKRGGAVANVWINDTSGREIDIVMGFDNASQYDSYEGYPILNGVIGRYAGIIGNGEYELDGAVHNPIKNSEDGRSTVHGGSKGWGNSILHVGARTKNSITFVVFDRGIDGFPGRAAASLTHTLLPNEWRIAYGVTPLVERYPISLSQQIFWNLDGFVSGSGSNISDHELYFPYGGLRLEKGDQDIPTGNILANKRHSCYDFWSEPRAVSTSLDDTFIINRQRNWDMSSSPVVILSSKTSGVNVELFTNQEAIHAVTWKDDTGKVGLKKSQGKGAVRPLAAISLQMQDWSDAINHPEWQREDKVIWGPDRLYVMYSTFKFSVK